MSKCKICNTETEVQFNVKRELIPVCKKCATAIFLQQAKFYAQYKSIYDLPQTYKKKGKQYPKIAVDALNYLNEKLGKKHRYTEKDIPDVFLTHISERVEEGHTWLKIKAVIYHKVNEWINDDYMKQFLRPATLFNREKFNTYVTEIPEHYNPDNSKEQRDLMRKLNLFGLNTCNDETDALAKKLQATGFENKNYLNIYLTKKI